MKEARKRKSDEAFTKVEAWLKEHPNKPKSAAFDACGVHQSAYYEGKKRHERNSSIDQLAKTTRQKPGPKPGQKRKSNPANYQQIVAAPLTSDKPLALIMGSPAQIAAMLREQLQ